MRLRHVLPLTLITLALMLAPMAAANATPGFGKVIGDIDDDRFPVETGGPETFTFRDTDSSGSLGASEPAFLTRSSTTVQAGDLRLANPLTGSAGSHVSQGASDAGLSVSSLSGTLRFFDKDSSGSFGPGDSLYYDLSTGQTSRVSVGDLQLTGSGAPGVVGSSSGELGFSLTDLSNPTIGFYDADDDNAYDNTEAPVVDVDSDNYVTAGDVRLASTAGGGSGTVVDWGDGDATPRLTTFTETWSIQYRDADSSGSFGATDPVFITKGSSVSVFAVRLANPSEGQPGDQVAHETEQGWNLATTSLDGSYGYVGSGSFTASNTAYYDLSASGSDTVTAQDLILTGTDAGTLVAGGHGNLNQALTSLSLTLKYLDTDGNDRYDAGDVVYADVDGDDFVSQYDIQLSASPGATGGDGGGDGDDDTDDGTDDGDTTEPDADNDGVSDAGDNCPNVANADQADDDNDGIGNVCDETPDGTTDEEPEEVEDEQAREQAQQAQQDAAEAKQAAQQAQQTAQEAKEAAQGALDTAQGNSEKLDQVLSQLGNGTGTDGDDQEGVPAPGLVAVLAALAVALVAVRRR